MRQISRKIFWSRFLHGDRRSRIFPPDKPYTRNPVRMHMYRFEKTEIRFYFEFYKDALNQELEAFLMAFKLKNHLFPDESARCFVPEEEEEISEMLLKAQKFAEDIDKSNPVRRIASADLSADPDALES